MTKDILKMVLLTEEELRKIIKEEIEKYTKNYSKINDRHKAYGGPK
jgi:hypothetical protein